MVQTRRRVVFLILTLVFVFSIFPTKSLASEPESDWFKNKPLISNAFDMGGDSLPFSINGNRDCIKQRIITKPAKILPYWPYVQHEESHDSCVINTGYGAVSHSGYLQTAGESTFGRVTYPWNGSMTLLPVPRSANGLYIEQNSPNGIRLFLIRDFLSNIDGATLASGEIVYKVKVDALPLRLDGQNRQPLGIQIDSVSFSSSGKWMVADIPTLGLSRIDTNSFSVQTFDISHNYNIGVAPGVQSAITNNGRYVAVSSPNFTRFRLYDLDDCSSGTACRYLDLQKYFKDNVPGFISGVRLRFSTDYSLRMHMVQQVGTAKKLIRQTLRAAGHESVEFGYLGLGDSFASGEGAYQYKASTDTGQNKCHVSLRSYPYLIADELGINEAESIACTGATIEDITSASRDYVGQVQDGIRRGDREGSEVENIVSAFLAGYLAQIEHVSQQDPEIVTISTVGNDIGFADKIKACLMPGTCYSTYEDRLEVAQEVNAQFDRVVGMYADIKEEMQGKKVYVIGYPEIAMDNGNCGNNVKLDAHELKFANQLVRHLNDMIESASKKVGFFYVDVEQAFYGHRLCETEYSNAAINGITAGDDEINIPFTDFGGPIGNESFHPNDLGHRKFKEAILSKTSDFSAPMPAPLTTATAPKITSNIELLKNMPKSGRETKAVKYVESVVEEDSVYRNEELDGTLLQTESGFKPNSNTQVWLHSDPIKLGDYTTDSGGNLSFEATIPEDIPFGFHTIHVYGVSITGRPIDIQKVIYVAEEPVTEPTPEEPTNPPEETNSEEQPDPEPTEEPETPEPTDESEVPDQSEEQSPQDLEEEPDTPNETEQVPDPEPVEQEENKTPVSNGDPKPPADNPETVAGHEETIAQVETLETTQPQTLTNTTYAQGPFQTPNPSSPSTSPQVAAATDNKAPLKGDGRQTYSSDYWPYLLATPLLLVFLAIFVIKKPH